LTRSFNSSEVWSDPRIKMKIITIYQCPSKCFDIQENNFIITSKNFVLSTSNLDPQSMNDFWQIFPVSRKPRSGLNLSLVLAWKTHQTVSLTSSLGCGITNRIHFKFIVILFWKAQSLEWSDQVGLVRDSTSFADALGQYNGISCWIQLWFD